MAFPSKALRAMILPAILPVKRARKDCPYKCFLTSHRGNKATESYRRMPRSGASRRPGSQSAEVTPLSAGIRQTKLADWSARCRHFGTCPVT